MHVDRVSGSIPHFSRIKTKRFVFARTSNGEKNGLLFFINEGQGEDLNSVAWSKLFIVERIQLLYYFRDSKPVGNLKDYLHIPFISAGSFLHPVTG